MKTIALEKFDELHVSYIPHNPVPMAGEAEQAGLVEDMAKHGIEEPIILFRPDKSELLYLIDGRNRLEAAKPAGVVKVPYEVRTTDDYPELIGLSGEPLMQALRILSVRMAVHRRHLSSGQKTALIASILQREEASGAENEKAPERGRGAKSVVVGGKRTSIRQAAKKLGTTTGTVQRAKELNEALEKRPHLAGKPVATIIRRAREEEKRENATPEEVAKASVLAHAKRALELCGACEKAGKCEYLSKFFAKAVHSGECGRPVSDEKVRDVNDPAVQLIEFYKELTGVAKEDRAWNRVNFPRFRVPAKTILSAVGDDLEKAKKLLSQTAEYFKRQGAPWTMFTAAKPTVLTAAYGRCFGGAHKRNQQQYGADVKLGQK